jgi:hypothetical protein
MVPASTLAETFDAFGPAAYERLPGPPQKIVTQFTVSNPEAHYTLHLLNHRIASATITLNGEVLFGPSDFNQQVDALETTVQLQAENELSVLLEGEPGGHIEIRIVGVDEDLPTITASVSPPANSAAWHSTDVTVSFDCNDETSGIASCSGPLTITSEGEAQVFVGTATDAAGKVATAPVTLNIDKTPPTLVISSPLDNDTVGSQEVPVQGTAADTLSGVDRVEVNGVIADLTGAQWSAVASLGSDELIEVTLFDRAGNSISQNLSVNVVTEAQVLITDPLDDLVTQSGVQSVSGSVLGADVVTVNGVQATVVDSVFTASVALIEGTNSLIATAIGDDGSTASDSVRVRRDTSPPVVVVESPAENARLVEETVAIAGTVNDIIPGATVNSDDVSVVVNGIPAVVNNRTFFLDQVPLDVGINTFDVIAMDLAGNQGVRQIQVTREPDLAGIRISIVSGNAQGAPINTLLVDPLGVLVKDADGAAIADRLVTFTVSNGDGLLVNGAAERRSTSLLTDANGTASLDFRIGSRTGMGLHRVRVTSPGALSTVEFCATATTSAPANIAINDMPTGRGVTGQPLADSLSTIVTDAGGNPVPGVLVTFEVTAGAGSFNGQPATQATTSPDGVAEVVWTLGPESGSDNNRATATFAGNPGLPAVFTASGVETGDVAATSVSGVVQNSAGAPIPNVSVDIRGTALEALTGVDGRFNITGVQPGGHHVGIHGSTANDPNTGLFFPDIEFAIDAISGVDNTIEPPIVVLPFLNTEGARLAGGPVDVVLTIPGVDGFQIKVFANSTYHRNPDTGELVQYSAFMSSSQVKFDKVPMPPPQGSTPLIVGTLQPGGIILNPPAQVTYPNVEGLAPGDVADIFAFHHDIGQFVNIGPGTVSEDGSVVTSDPGFGIVQSGWHCMVRFPGGPAICSRQCTGAGQCDDGNDCTEDSCEDGQCVLTITPAAPCDDGNDCTFSDICNGDVCMGIPDDGAACDDGNECTTNDTCDVTTCGGTPNPAAPCDDGNECTSDDICNGDVCMGIPDDGGSCDDGDQCTVDQCDAGDCSSIVATGIPCNDGDATTYADTCAMGVCLGIAEEDFDDDGVSDSVDNCPSVPNPDQADEDGNGVGDVCETCSLPEEQALRQQRDELEQTAQDLEELADELRDQALIAGAGALLDGGQALNNLKAAIEAGISLAGNVKGCAMLNVFACWSLISEDVPEFDENFGGTLDEAISARTAVRDAKDLWSAARTSRIVSRQRWAEARAIAHTVAVCSQDPNDEAKVADFEQKIAQADMLIVEANQAIAELEAREDELSNELANFNAMLQELENDVLDALDGLLPVCIEGNVPCEPCCCLEPVCTESSSCSGLVLCDICEITCIGCLQVAYPEECLP